MVIGNDKNVFISCECGCGLSYSFKVLDKILYVEALNSEFYTKQSKIKYKILDKCRLINKKLSKKPLDYNFVILKKEEFWAFINYLTIIVNNMPDNINENIKEYSHKETSSIHIYQTNIQNTEFVYEIGIRSHLNIKNLLLNEHRTFDLYFTKKQMICFLENIKKKFKLSTE